MNEILTYCSEINNLGLFCSEFPDVNGTVCSQIGHLGPNLGLFCSDFLSESFCCAVTNIVHRLKNVKFCS